MKQSFKIKGGFDGLIQQAKSALQVWSMWAHFKVVVNNEVYYFRWVEEGTYKMDARAMVALSKPYIQEFVKQQTEMLGPFPHESEVLAAIGRIREYALFQIQSRTPVGVDKKLPNGDMHKAGTLKAGMRVVVVRGGQGFEVNPD